MSIQPEQFSEEEKRKSAEQRSIKLRKMRAELIEMNRRTSKVFNEVRESEVKPAEKNLNLERMVTLYLDPSLEKWVDNLSPEERDNEINNALRKGIKILSKLNPGIFGVTEIPMTLS